ncbi:MAG: glycosyltransferase family 1 protein [Rhodobiaceae bacterium]|nr:glycosyltransferase family 1 protein [Rhodobiaceae bacterium]
MSGFLSFIAPPYAGHLNTQIYLARAAIDRGYRAEIITGPGKIDMVRALGVPAHCPPMLADGILEAVPETKGTTFTNPFRLIGQIMRTVKLLAPVRDHLVDRWRADPPDCVVADFVAVPAGLAADAFSIPWVTIAAPAFVLETRSGPPSYMGGLSPIPGPLGALRDKAGWMAMTFAKDMLFRLFLSEFRRLGLVRLRPDGTEAIYSSRAIFCPGLREMEFAPRWPEAVSFLGHVPFTPEGLDDCPPLDLPEGRPAVLVTFGTHVPWAKDRMVRQTKALARRMPHVHFAISMGDGRLAGTPPVEQVDNVSIHGFIPYTQEMSRFDAVIHHGGAGVAMATVAAGLPALVCAQDYDQPDCAARIAHFGLGHRIRHIDSASTAQKLAAVLSEKPPALARFAALAAGSDPQGVFFSTIDRLVAADGARAA